MLGVRLMWMISSTLISSPLREKRHSQKSLQKGETSSDENDLGPFSEGDEPSSPLCPSGHPRVPQADYTEMGPTFILGQERKTLYSRLGQNPIEAIKNPKKCQLLFRFLQHSRVLPRNVIQLALTLERLAGQWP